MICVLVIVGLIEFILRLAAFPIVGILLWSVDGDLDEYLHPFCWRLVEQALKVKKL